LGNTSDQVKTKLESLGYTQVRDIVSTPDGITAKAMKGDKPMTIAIDASGKVTESQIGP
jgi:metal-dependent amidase/aminoacylase/carboxypeptidase family protein